MAENRGLGDHRENTFNSHVARGSLIRHPHWPGGHVSSHSVGSAVSTLIRTGHEPDDGAAQTLMCICIKGLVNSAGSDSDGLRGGLRFPAFSASLR